MWGRGGAGRLRLLRFPGANAGATGSSGQADAPNAGIASGACLNNLPVRPRRTTCAAKLTVMADHLLRPSRPIRTVRRPVRRTGREGIQVTYRRRSGSLSTRMVEFGQCRRSRRRPVGAFGGVSTGAFGATPMPERTVSTGGGRPARSLRDHGHSQAAQLTRCPIGQGSLRRPHRPRRVAP